jgi:hypothetical protein
MPRRYPPRILRWKVRPASGAVFIGGFPRFEGDICFAKNDCLNITHERDFSIADAQKDEREHGKPDKKG